MVLGFSSFRSGKGIIPISGHGILILLSMLLIFSSSQTLFAASNEPDPAASDTGGVRFKAESIVLKPASNSAEYIDNVIITQGETVITADKVTVFFKKDSGSGLSLNEDSTGSIENSIEKIVATGSIRIVSTDIVATADEAVYDLAGGSLVMTGDPATIVKGANTMSAPVIEMIGAL